MGGRDGIAYNGIADCSVLAVGRVTSESANWLISVLNYLNFDILGSCFALARFGVFAWERERGRFVWCCLSTTNWLWIT